MQKTLEILKNEDGLIIKRLSYKKLLFVYQVPILLGISSDVVVGYLPVKIRYRTNNEPFADLMGEDYKCCDLTKLYKTISQKYQIKMNQIDTKYDRRNINIQEKNHTFDRVINSFHFVDPAWIRDYKLENIL
jgi:hypothetical protein